MARKSKNADKNITETISQEADMISLNSVGAMAEVDLAVDVQSKIKKTFKIKLSPYVKHPISCEKSKIKITNLGFGDVTELNSKKMIFTGDAKVFDNDIIIESTSFPVVRIELF